MDAVVRHHPEVRLAPAFLILPPGEQTRERTDGTRDDGVAPLDDLHGRVVVQNAVVAVPVELVPGPRGGGPRSLRDLPCSS